MVRAVVRQRNVPYALIVFVALFVIAFGFAVFVYMHDDGKATRISDLEDIEKKLTADIEELNEQMATLAGSISSSKDFARAAADYEEILPDEGMDPLGYNRDLDLIANLREFRRQIDQQTSRADGLVAKLDAQESALTAEVQHERDRRIAMETVLAEQAAEMAALKTAQQAERTNLTRQRDEDREQFASIRRELERDNNVLTTDLAHERDKVREREEELDDLKRRYVALRQPQLAEGQKIYPDGSITRVVDEKTCYISLGSGNGVLEDWIFSVYSRGDAEAAKAQIIVKQVFEETSECVVAREDRKDPIAEGDIIASIAFDENRQYTFLVKGQFDIQGGGEATDEGRDQVIALIRQFGGKVVDDVDIDVDFVVLGPEPAIPAEPDKDMPATMRDIYEARLRQRDEYLKVKQEAIHLRLRILNTNRFLERIGYVPVKTLTYEESY